MYNTYKRLYFISNAINGIAFLIGTLIYSLAYNTFGKILVSIPQHQIHGTLVSAFPTRLSIPLSAPQTLPPSDPWRLRALNAAF